MDSLKIESLLSRLIQSIPLVTRYKPDGLTDLERGIAALTNMLDDAMNRITNG